MNDRYMLIFNSENPPMGTKKNEMINHSLARLRRILLHEIEIIGVSGVIIQINGSVMQDGDLVSRLGSIPILKDPGTKTLALNVKAQDEPFEVLSDYILTVSGLEAPIPTGITLTILPPREELSVNLFLKKGSVKSTNNVHFSPISTITFYPVKSETKDFYFMVELVQGFTEDDFNDFMNQAYFLMENGGGAVTDQTKFSGKKKMKKKYDITQSDIRMNLLENKEYIEDNAANY